jgi:hypothetical protein
VSDGLPDQGGVEVIQAGESIAEVDRDAFGEAGG